MGYHSRLAVILYAPGSMFYDEKVRVDLAERIIIVANQHPEPELGANTGIVNSSSVMIRFAAWRQIYSM